MVQAAGLPPTLDEGASHGLLGVQIEVVKEPAGLLGTHTSGASGSWTVAPQTDRPHPARPHPCAPCLQSFGRSSFPAHDRLCFSTPSKIASYAESPGFGPR